jgi:hypothetical protein
MTPKETAEQLVEKYSYLDGNHNSYHYDKQCALICVDEILNAVTTIADKKYDYWQEVKKQIELL